MANKIRPYKFEIVPIVQILDDDGEVIGEGTPAQFMPPKGSPSVVYGCKNLETWAREFPEFIEELQKRLDAIAAVDVSVVETDLPLEEPADSPATE